MGDRCDTDKGNAENVVGQWPLRRRHGTGSLIGLVTDRSSRLVPPDTPENMGRDGPETNRLAAHIFPSVSPLSSSVKSNRCGGR